MEKEATNLKESREDVWEAFEGRKGREKYNLNNKNTNKNCKLFTILTTPFDTKREEKP